MKTPDQFWACPDPELIPETQRAGMIIAIALALELDRESAVQTIGQAAQWEGKSFDESLTAYFWTYTDGIIPNAIPYGGRVASR